MKSISPMLFRLGKGLCLVSCVWSCFQVISPPTRSSAFSEFKSSCSWLDDAPKTVQVAMSEGAQSLMEIYPNFFCSKTPTRAPTQKKPQRLRWAWKRGQFKTRDQDKLCWRVWLHVAFSELLGLYSSSNFCVLQKWMQSLFAFVFVEARVLNWASESNKMHKSRNKRLGTTWRWFLCLN